MRKSLFLLFALAAFLFACSSNGTKKAQAPNWTTYSKNTFMQKCVGQAGSQMLPKEADNYCNCIMEKMIAAYPDTVELDKMGPAKIKSESMAMALKCLF
ncbi:MAG: hypothetical protein HYU69_15255 [Bacteroidetes bacterium]|nr:hypothetical protein [Bacteroidota bacterium]